MLAAPAALRAKVENARKQVTTGQPKQSGTPCAMVLTAASYSPRGAGLVSPRHRRFQACRVREDRHRQTAGLISASGDQDHTTWPSAFRSLVWRPHRVHRIPPSTLLTMRSAPLIERGMQEQKHKFPKNGRGIFLHRGLDRANQVEMAGENQGVGARLLVKPVRKDVGVCDVRVAIRSRHQASQPARPPRPRC